MQYDLMELRDAHAKLRGTNEKLRRDKEKGEKGRDDLFTMVIPNQSFHFSLMFSIRCRYLRKLDLKMTKKKSLGG